MMNISGDARFLSWGVYLEPNSSINRLRYILFFDLRNSKLLLINCSTQTPSSYDFSCVSDCDIDLDLDETHLILDLKNTQQSYTVNLYFDSFYDRNCCNELLTSIKQQKILQIAPKFGITADLEIGCQIQEKSASKSQWQPRVLSLVQNRILLFRDKSQDYHPLKMISLNEPMFKYYKTDYYDHTIEIHLSHNKIYQFHLGDDNAINRLNSRIRLALSQYNKAGLV